MRPAVFALIAALLPLGAYAHPAHWADAQTEKAKPVSAKADTAKEKEKTKPAEGTAIANAGEEAPAVPRTPAGKTPLCASPEVSTWNPAATGKGIICKPTMWA